MLPLSRRRDRKIMSLAFKIAASPAHILHETLLNPPQHSTRNVSFACRANMLAERAQMSLSNIRHDVYVKIPPWTSKPRVDLRMSLCQPRCRTLARRIFAENIKRYGDARRIYTDGSKTTDGVSAAMVNLEVDTRSGFHLPNYFSIFSAEAFAILQAIKSSTDGETVILSDSMSVLNAIASRLPSRNPIVQEICSVLDSDTSISLMWVPGHLGIEGNEAADAEAGKALSLPLMDCGLPHRDATCVFNGLIVDAWTEEWRSSDSFLSKWKTNCRRSSCMKPLPRSLAVRLTRLRLGRIRLTECYKFTSSPPPTCEFCEEQLTVDHILLSPCDHLEEQQRRFGIGPLNNSEYFEQTMEYAKAIGVWHRL